MRRFDPNRISKRERDRHLIGWYVSPQLQTLNTHYSLTVERICSFFKDIREFSYDRNTLIGRQPHFGLQIRSSLLYLLHDWLHRVRMLRPFPSAAVSSRFERRRFLTHIRTERATKAIKSYRLRCSLQILPSLLPLPYKPRSLLCHIMVPIRVLFFASVMAASAAASPIPQTSGGILGDLTTGMYQLIQYSEDVRNLLVLLRRQCPGTSEWQ